MTTPTSFADALRVPAITHDTIDDLFATEADLRKAAHLLLDQRDTARSLAALLEQELHDATTRPMEYAVKLAPFGVISDPRPTPEEAVAEVKSAMSYQPDVDVLVCRPKPDPVADWTEVSP